MKRTAAERDLSHLGPGNRYGDNHGANRTEYPRSEAFIETFRLSRLFGQNPSSLGALYDTRAQAVRGLLQ